MTSEELYSLLRQVPASLLFRKKGENNFHASNAFFQLFETVSVDSKALVAPTFLNTITERELLGNACPAFIVESGKQLSERVKVKYGSTVHDCFLSGGLVEANDSDYVVIHVSSSTAALHNDSNYSSVAHKHILFNQLLSTLSSKLIKASSSELNVIINKCLAAFGEFSGVDRCYLFKFIENDTAMKNTHEWVSNGVTPFIDDLQALPVDSLPYFTKLLRQGLFKLDDIAQLPQEAHLEREEFVREGIFSVLCAPVHINMRLYGFIGCDIIGSPYQWREHDVDYLTQIGEMLGNTIENVENREAVQKMQSDLLNANRKLEKLANIDGLTGIPNRRLFDNTLNPDIQRCEEKKYDLSLLLLDVDNFKEFNDTYGHVAGDKVLQQVADVLKAVCNGNDDLVARYGGEEFAIILPKTDHQTALYIANKMVQKVCELNIPHSGSEHNEVLTVSIGAVTKHNSQTMNSAALIERADKALYRAKSSGKNCVYG